MVRAMQAPLLGPACPMSHNIGLCGYGSISNVSVVAAVRASPMLLTKLVLEFPEYLAVFG
jgi:hypothetical protein